MKMKAMRMLRFGNHIAKIPSYNFARYYDYPLTGYSSASHTSISFKNLCASPDNVFTIIESSQRLEGNMIPVLEEEQQNQKELEAHVSMDLGIALEESKSTMKTVVKICNGP